MANPRLPIELVIANGKKHLTKNEIEQRRSCELKVELKNIVVPKYLSAKMKKEFMSIAEKLLTIGIMTELDEDCLARYITAHHNYLVYTKLLSKVLRAEDIEQITKVQRNQDIAFKQCMTAAAALGLTISSRCKLVVPQAEKEQPKNKFDRFRKPV